MRGTASPGPFEDGFASNGPHIKLLKQLDMRFILGAKPADQAALFEWVASTERMHTATRRDRARQREFLVRS